MVRKNDLPIKLLAVLVPLDRVEVAALTPTVLVPTKVAAEFGA